jgi:1-acyl-sn-glycerol-3-phosphate acyltransferase
VIPVAMFNTAEIQPTGKVIPKILRVEMKFGEPMYFQGVENGSDPEKLRKATDQIMKKLQEMSGQEYVDIYASQAKEALDAERKKKPEKKRGRKKR